ncbi:MAG TPA: OmpA family protein [Candidatus Binataceae bacterium]|nr:OmpA family protein [Candidatus Binataceae bacterium]
MTDLAPGEFIDRDTLLLVREYPHPPLRVWDALTNAEQVSIWFLHCTRLEARVGGRYAFESDGKSWGGRITAYEPLHLIDFSGAMRFELFAQAAGCRLELRLKRTAAGWNPMSLAGFNGWLGRLRRLVDGVAPEEAERWASDQFPWEGLCLMYERLLGVHVAGGAKVTYRIHFEPNLATLGPEAKMQLGELVRVLRAQPDLRLNIDGFGDDPCSFEESLVLSGRRVDAIVRYLEGAGVAGERIEAGFALGNYHFLVPRDTEAGRAFNRRVELRPIY